MAVKIISATYSGLEGKLIDVEVDITKGMPYFAIVGLPDIAIKEAKERVKSAIINSGFEFPLGRVVVNLAPADIKKIGSLLDLPIALGILAASKQINSNNFNKYIFFGELSLGGDIKGVKGTLPIILEGLSNSINKFVLPMDNIEECKYAREGQFFPFNTLIDSIKLVNFNEGKPYEKFEDINEIENNILSYDDIIGQESSKRAMEIVAAGKHNIFLYGSTGVGKTMLANAILSILPMMSKEEEVEVAKVNSISSLSNNGKGVTRPFRSPHHSITKGGLIGGGNGSKAGEITLAHRGILFLDEILEFKREVLEELREPLEEGTIKINRLYNNFVLPSDFILIGSFNLCPCGRKSYEDVGLEGCSCSDTQRSRYLNRMSKAIADRVDIYNYVPRVSYKEIKEKNNQYSSFEMKERVAIAREMQSVRYKNTSYKFNGEVRGKDVFEACRVSSMIEEILKGFFDFNNPSLRGYSKLLKVARTIADLNGQKDISEENVLEAISYRKNYSGDII